MAAWTAFPAATMRYAHKQLLLLLLFYLCCSLQSWSWRRGLPSLQPACNRLKQCCCCCCCFTFAAVCSPGHGGVDCLPCGHHALTLTNSCCCCCCCCCCFSCAAVCSPGHGGVNCLPCSQHALRSQTAAAAAAAALLMLQSAVLVMAAWTAFHAAMVPTHLADQQMIAFPAKLATQVPVVLIQPHSVWWCGHRKGIATRRVCMSAMKARGRIWHLVMDPNQLARRRVARIV
jgi:hypothetical protein